MALANRGKEYLAKGKSLILIILFLGFTTCIYAPFEMYLTNRDELWFQVSQFWWVPLACGLTAMLAAWILGILFKGKLRSLYEGGLFGFALASYIQGNFLNLRVGVLNGADIPWREYRRHFIIDGVIFCLIVIIFLVMSFLKNNIFRKVSCVVSAFLVAIQFVALIVMLVPAVMEAKPQEEIGFLSDKDLYKVASDENIIVFLLDMFDDTYFKQIMEEEPEIADQLEGFTYFNNATGAYSTTVYSVMHIMSGDYFLNEMSRGIWPEERGKSRLWQDELTESGYELNLYGYSNWIPTRIVEESTNYVNAALRINHYKNFTIDLYRLVMCKYFPDMLKPYIWMNGNELNRWKEPDSEYHAFSTDNIVFRDGITQEGISIGDADKIFKFIHIDGSHYPYYIDENANRVEEDSVSAVSCARGALRIVQNYMDGMKKNGSYENASIFIIADHGYYWDGVLTNPVMLVKPSGSVGKMNISNAPVCQKDLQATILELAGLNQDHSYGKSVFEIQEGEKRERLFYQYNLQEQGNGNGNYRLIEYSIDSDSNDRSSFHLTDVEYSVDGVKGEHIKYCKTCEEGVVTDDHEPPRIVHYRK